MERKLVKFLVDHSPYMAGETAAFFEKEADRLVDRGIAAVVDKPSTGSAQRLKDLAEGKNVPAAPETKHIPAAPQTRHIPGPESTKTGPATGRKCGKCGKPGHNRGNCPQK